MSGISPSAPPSTALDGELQAIDIAYEKWNQKALKHQKRQRRFGFFTAFLGPVAVLLLTVQILAFPQAGPVSVTLIAAELAALGIALIFGFFNMGTPNTWMSYRLRAEMLRREKFLVLGRVGPYLSQVDPANVIERRLVRIDNDKTPPVELIPLQETNGETWRDGLEDARAHNEQTAPPDTTAFDTFREKRVMDQKNWYSDKSTYWASRDELLENVAKGVLVMALVVSAWHLANLYLLPATIGNERTQSQLVTEILAIVLPPIGAAAAALQSLLEGRRLSRSYDDRARALIDIDVALLKLKGDSAKVRREEYDFRFKRLVLRAEETLANELLQWWSLKHT
jgi:hypothetical protein